jgi:hypothetical protein
MTPAEPVFAPARAEEARVDRGVAKAGARSAPLVLDGQRSRSGWCERGPDDLRYWVNGRYVRPRCKRRDCPRCWAIRSRETARCLVLDAAESMPTLCMTLTTHDPCTLPETYRNGSAVVFRRLRRLYGDVEYFGAIEFTTGRASRSGGLRRLHGHYLLKGLGADLVLDVERVAIETWERTTGAWRVEVAALRSPGAALGYLGLHHRKPEQAPPSEWRGMTERASKGYWTRPVEELRRQARAELAAEAIAWRSGCPLELAERVVDDRGPVELRRVRSRPDATVVEPLGVPAWR